MNKQRLALIVGLVLGLGLMAAAIGSLKVMPVWAGPRPAPTPITSPAGGDDWVMVNYLSTQTLSQTTGYTSTGFQTASYVVADIQCTLDVTTTGMNTTTCYIDWSNDDTNWDIGITVCGNDRDMTDMQQFNMFGRYSRVRCVISESSLITMTVIGKAHDN